MDIDAQRRARRQVWKPDLSQAYDDEQACPPQWADLASQIRRDCEALRNFAAAETAAFVAEGDIRVALRRRESAENRIRDEASRINAMILRLNLIAPLERFQRIPLDAGELVRPLYFSPRGR